MTQFLKYFLGIFVVCAVVGGGYYLFTKDKDRIREIGQGPSYQTDSSSSSDSCPPALQDIMDISAIEKIGPPGRTTESGFKTHAVIFFTGATAELRAPVDMQLFEGSKYLEKGKVQYLLHFQGPCNIRFNLDHISDPVKTVADQFPGEAPVDDSRTKQIGPIQFKAGEVIGTTSGNALVRSFDIGMYDLNKTNYLKDDPQYKNHDPYSAWKYWNAVCPFDYYDVTKKQAYYSKIQSIDGTAVPTTFCTQ